MKELDILLERFLEQHGTELESGAWPELEELLKAEDDALWDWLQGRRPPPSRHTQLVNAIRG